MRVKVAAKQYGVDKFEFGKSYYLAYAGVTYAETVLFTRKNRVELSEIVRGKKVASRLVSKRELEQLLNDGLIHWMGEV